MILFQNVSKAYSSSQLVFALKNISLEIKEKEFVSITGKSGAGKTTLLKLILAEEYPTEGKLFFEGKDIQKIKKREIHLLRRKIGTVFQDYKLFSNKTAFENIAYVLEVIGVSDEEIRYNVPQVLEIVGLSEKAENYPYELSAGEKQRVAIARALIHRPKVILADEPTGNLDPYTALDIMRLLVKINEMGTTIILATHEKELVNKIGKRVVTLENGRIIRDKKRGRFAL